MAATPNSCQRFQSAWRFDSRAVFERIQQSDDHTEIWHLLEKFLGRMFKGGLSPSIEGTLSGIICATPTGTGRELYQRTGVQLRPPRSEYQWSYATAILIRRRYGHAKSILAFVPYSIESYSPDRKVATTAPLLERVSSFPETLNSSTVARVFAKLCSSSIKAGGPAILVLTSSPMVTLSPTRA